MSNRIDHASFCRSFFRSLRSLYAFTSGHARYVRQKLQKAEISFNETDKADCLSFNSITKIDEAIILNKEAVIQDYNSQKYFLLCRISPLKK